MTLLELVLVACILVLMAAVAIPRFANSIVQQRLDAAAHRVTKDLAFAQRRAEQTGEGLTVKFDPGTDSYVLDGVIDPDHPEQTYTVHLASLPYEVRLVSADFNGDGELVFDALGDPDSGGTITLGRGRDRRDLTIDADTGLATMVERVVEPAQILETESLADPNQVVAQ